MKKIFSLLSALLILAALVIPVSAEELLLHDSMENFKNMVGYSANKVYNDYNEDKQEFFEEYWNKPAIMKFAGGELDSWIMYDIAGATKVEATALIAERAVTDPLGIEPNNLIFETSPDQQTWTKIKAGTKLREQPGKWTEAKYTVTGIPDGAQFLRITLYIPEGVPTWCSRVYSVDIYGNKPTQTPITATSTTATSAAVEESSTIQTDKTETSTVAETDASVDSTVINSTNSAPVNSSNTANNGLIIGVVIAAVVLIGAGAAFIILYKAGKLPIGRNKKEK